MPGDLEVVVGARDLDADIEEEAGVLHRRLVHRPPRRVGVDGADDDVGFAQQTPGVGGQHGARTGNDRKVRVDAVGEPGRHVDLRQMSSCIGGRSTRDAVEVAHLEQVVVDDGQTTDTEVRESLDRERPGAAGADHGDGQRPQRRLTLPPERPNLSLVPIMTVIAIMPFERFELALVGSSVSLNWWSYAHANP